MVGGSVKVVIQKELRAFVSTPPVGSSLCAADFWNLRKHLPPPPCFWQRVRKRLKRKGLSFARVQKNAKKCKRVRNRLILKGRKFAQRRADDKECASLTKEKN